MANKFSDIEGEDLPSFDAVQGEDLPSVPVATEAHPLPAPPSPAPGGGLNGPTAALRGISKGGTFGFVEKAGAKLASLPGVGRYLNTPLEEWFKDSPQVAPEMTEDEALKDIRGIYKETAKQRPLEFYGGEAAGALMTPGPGKAKGATALARGAKTLLGGGAMAGLYGLGSSEADLSKGEFGQAGKDVGVSALLGGAASMVPWLGTELGGKIVSAAEKGSATARRLIQEAVKRAQMKELASAAGAKGGASSAGRNNLDVLREIVSRAGELPEELVAKAKAALTSPEAGELERGVYSNAIEGFGSKMGAIKSAQSAIEEALAKGTPEALAAAEEAAMANPLTAKVWPRIRKQIIDRGVIPAVGATVGSMFGGDSTTGKAIGAGTGAVGGLVAGALMGGKASTAFEKMLADPAVKAMLMKWLSGLGKTIEVPSRAAGKLVPVAAGAAGSNTQP